MSYMIKNSHEAKSVLPPWDYDMAVVEVKKASKEGMLVSVRAQTDTITDTDYLYGVFAMTEDDYILYRQNGGIWTYIPPDKWLED